jgi:DNA-binding MarR family transcriptional regulator
MNEERSRLIEHIINQEARVYEIVKTWPKEWLSTNLTMPQLKILFLLYGGGAVSMGELAAPLEVKLSTITGIVDRLVEQGMVQRGDDPRDRRLVLCHLTDDGRQIVDRLYRAIQIQVTKILEKLTLEDLRVVAQAWDILYEAMLAEQQTSESVSSLPESEERL